MKGSFTDLKDLEEWFMDVPSNEGKYIVYHGTVARANGNSSARCLYNDDDKLGKEDAWDQIKSFFHKSRGGEYTVLVKEGHKNTGPRAFYDQTGSAGKGRISGYGGQYAAFGGVDQYIDMRLKMDELERRLEEGEPNLSFLERVFTPELVQEFAMSLLPSMKQGQIPGQVEQAPPQATSNRDQKIESLIDAINGLDDNQLDGVIDTLNNPAIINMLKQAEQ